MDSAPEERFDRIAKLAREIFKVPIALVSLVDQDRQWFKSCFGLEVTETTRDVSFCAHAILHEGVFVIPDATSDPRFANNPLVTGEPGIRFYAGAPLRTTGGFNLGTLCIIDTEPRTIDRDQQRMLMDLAALVVDELELRSALQEAASREELIEQARAGAEEISKAKDQFLSRMNHAFRTPLNSILGFGQLLKDSLSDEEQRADVDEILTAAGRLVDMADNALGVSRAVEGRAPLHLARVELTSVVTDGLEKLLLQEPDRLSQIQIDVPTGLSVVADHDQLARVVRELAANAFHHGTGKVSIQGMRSDGTVSLQVWNGAPSLDEGELERLFEPFESADGLGLGLTLAKGLVESMRGTLELVSDADRGIGAIVRLDETGQPAASGRAGDPLRVLYIDDNPSNLRLVAGLLAKRNDIELEIAADPVSGLEFARSELPDLILLDLNMPELNGEEVLAQLKGDPRTASIRVLVVTVEDDKVIERRVLAAGAAKFIRKPLDLAELMAAVEESFEMIGATS
ncbi:MAG: hypothetical protein QOG54_1129 [Actinomycetota bacterium]|jgi:signal transduction histidine kinase/ActR/RegA family two-component response regulator|nr:hypothetical protein [Actinomycetota bacterium]